MAEAEVTAAQAHDAVTGIYTETLARLYLKQGFGERALAIYRRLVQEQPANHQLHERLHTLEQALAYGGSELDSAVQCATPDGANESATPVRLRPEHRIAARLELWLCYLQRQRLQRERL